MYSLIIPFHRDYKRLEKILPRVQREAQDQGIREVLLVHNGPPLGTEELSLVRSWAPANYQILHTPTQGLGAAYKLGIQKAQQPYCILSSSDLHFGWSDLQSFLKLPTPPPYALGSKAHPESRIQRTWKRTIPTQILKVFRRIFLGSKTPGDSQGSTLLQTDLANSLIQQCRSNDYLFTLEMVSLYLAQGGSVVELPVELEAEIGPSNVSVLRDGLKMVWGILKLSYRLKRRRA
ncbi:MAG: glycosyltransferase [Pseudobdellovibrionaceae bacterium]